MSTKTTPKFQAILASTGQAVLDKRSKLVFSGTMNAMKDKLQALYRKRDELSLEILNLTDLSVESNDSLRPGGTDYNPGKWVDRMVQLGIQKEVLADEIMVAEKVAKEYFDIDPTPEDEEEEAPAAEAKS